MNAPAKLVREAAQPLTGSPKDYDPLLALIGEARFVPLGKASHGNEFYRERASVKGHAQAWMRPAVALGCSNYIVKPVDYDKFSEAIKQLGLFISLVQVPPINGRASG